MADGSLFGRVRGPIVVDLFAGGGGASHGIREALGVSPVVAINHDPHAIAMHTRNHPETEHYLESVFNVAPLSASRGRNVDLLWASPDCTHHSRARGGKPQSRGLRALAWIVRDWARDVQPTRIALENVPEFEQWGPLGDDDKPIKARRGEEFRAFVGALRELGYDVDWRNLRACDYGAPTSRKRLFLIARRDGVSLDWPAPTHGPGLLPYRTAAECIDWSVPCRSIFGRKKPLAENTLARIAEGIRRYVLGERRPFLLCLTHGGRLEPLDSPLRTTTTANREERAIVAPVLTKAHGNGWDRAGSGVWSAGEPVPTQTTTEQFAVAAAVLIQAGYGERRGQAPRVLDIGAPLGTVVSGGNKHALVCAFLDKHYSSARAGVPLDGPLPTVTGGGGHASLVAAFLTRYHGSGGQWGDLGLPAPCVTAREGLALVTVEIDGETWVMTDILMRMLTPRELARAQGFPDDYVLMGSKGDQIARIGNSVCPPLARVVAASLFYGDSAMAAK